ncbi:transposase [Candidatus Oscillochloris fontis]|uniref:transposase n=1 Tax=Candidatus Oscillochloris fontis TaxID=2496868 RepID=UPI00101C8AF0|nr:transposase [Candidatus Oscillochloris fontis]
MDRYKGRYRVDSTRWATWDYGSNAAYFVTICTAKRIHWFGKVVKGQMVLSPLGQVAADCWEAIPSHFPFVVPDVFVVMPNHVHGIVVINKTDDRDVAMQEVSLPSVAMHGNRFGPQSKNLAAIVRGYKAGVSTYARRNKMVFAWQARYHDHIIRNGDAHKRIRNYILANPQNWGKG